MTRRLAVLPATNLETASTCPLLKCDHETWIHCCTRRFSSLAKRVTRDDSLAEDALQDSWLRILQTTHGFRGDPDKTDRACHWVGSIVANAAKDIRRKQGPVGEVGRLEETASGLDPEAQALARQRLKLLRAMIAKLPEIYARVIELRVCQDLSVRQTAKQLQISPSNVTTRLNRAVKMIQRRIDHRLRDLECSALSGPL